MLRCVIIDDEPAGIAVLKIMIEKQAEVLRVVATTTSAIEGIELIESFRPDIVFLDISMPDMSGFELLDKVTNRNFKLVFTTAHREYAINAIKNRAFDYLLKPIDHEDFKKCIRNILVESGDKTEKLAHSKEQGLLEIQVRDGIIFIRQKDIIRIEASGSYSIFHVQDRPTYLASKSIKGFENLLDPEMFYRCHHSHIINLHKVEKFVNHEGFFAQMNDGSSVEISKRNKNLFLKRLKAL